MEKRDARLLTEKEQAQLRLTAVRMVQKGMKQQVVADCLGVSRQSVCGWWGAYRAKGRNALEVKKRGAPYGRSRQLTPPQEKEIQRKITDQTPDQLRLAFALWTRQAVCELVRRDYGVAISPRHMGNFLQRWGFTPQKLVKKTYEQQPAAVQAWLQETYPKIQARARREKAEIFWGDETAVRPEAAPRRSYAPKGRPGVVRAPARRFSASMISAINNQGQVHWLSFTEKMTADVFVRFLGQLIKYRRRKVCLIVDNLKAHHAKKVQHWLRARPDRLELFFLPAYSPELNPDEYLHNDLKQNVHRERIPKDQDELEENLWSHMFDLAADTGKVQRFFHHPKVQYAA